MATNDKTTPKPKKAPVAIAVRVEDQLRRAVLARKITKEEMTTLKEQVERLLAFMG